MKRELNYTESEFWNTTLSEVTELLNELTYILDPKKEEKELKEKERTLKALF